MAIPDYQTLMRPLLESLTENEAKVRDVIDKLANDFDLSQQEKEQKIPSGRQGLFYNRVHWAKTYLTKAGLISSPRRGFSKLTPQGVLALKSDEKIDNNFLTRFQEYNEFRELRHSEESLENIDIKEDPLNPEEELFAAFKALNADISGDLLSRLIGATPDFFEKTIVKLLVAMGYGGSEDEAVRQLGQTGDNGVDGVVDQDFLGVDQIYVQAKRYKLGNNIGAADIRNFYGALDYHNAQKGIFITSSDFTRSAFDTADKLNTNIVLINGIKLVELMLRFNVGVSEKDLLSIKEIDEEFFEE